MNPDDPQHLDDSATPTARGWDFWIDRGGTFTDIVARASDGAITSLKLLSESPGQYADAAVEGVRRVLSTAAPEHRRIRAVKMGTTVATNALLERRGEPTALVITAGFKDAIRIGGQQRPDIFALDIRLPEMLYVTAIEAHERIAVNGDVLLPLDEDRLRRDLAQARSSGLASVAIVFLHGYRFFRHELAAAAIAAELGFAQVSVSHRVSPLTKLVTRGDTTLVDAYLSPVLDRYVQSVRSGLGRSLGSAPLKFMQSHGGLIDAAQFRGKDSLLSGPAAGVIGMASAAAAAGFPRVIGFDMGGTSTDVSLFDGELERTGETVIAGVRVSAPMLLIHTVAAGGGSIVRFDNGRLQVGPESAGAYPGPACYRNCGPLTVTDANVYLGRIQADFFPRVFGAQANESIDTAAAAAAFQALSMQLGAATAADVAAEELAAGCLRIAVERMANAIKQISVQRGHDITRLALCCFGGAAGQHACQVADALGIGSVLIHPLAGVLSAYGMGVAKIRVLRQATIETSLDEAALHALPGTFDALATDARTALEAQGIGDDVQLLRRMRLKLDGADTSLTVDWEPQATVAALQEAFHKAHARHFGFRADERGALVIESVELEAAAPGDRLDERAYPRPSGRSSRPVEATAVRRIWFGECWCEAPVYRRGELRSGDPIDGPALITEDNATTVVEPHWRAVLDDGGCLLLSRQRKIAAKESVRTRSNPIMLEVFNNLFMHAAQQMGAVLESTAHSVNIKERLDFSCAVFDEDGQLIANAPHIPVHLGSMGDSVQSILQAHGSALAPGDAYMLNSPYKGGTHLPDVTVVTPVFGGRAQRLRFFVASRAHHADVGGTTPGSMPPHSRTIEEEGVLFDGARIVARGRFLQTEARRLFGSGAYPARNPDQNIADLAAQLAANARGVAELNAMVARFGIKVVRAYMRHVQDNAEGCVRGAIERLRDGRWTLELDGGERIAVSVAIDHARRAATIDFAGTSAQSKGNFNAPASIVRAAVLYVFRTLVRESIPLNAGCLRPLNVRVPERSLLSPRPPSAVVAGNVETSQCVTDALLAALDACAAAQGTMNNFTFGNARHQYYETICGGAGAGADFAGASAVHTHMTNSRLTDPEVLERRYPVRVRRFEIRAGSGGGGAQRGGDGVLRDIEFLEPMHAAILSNRRRTAAFGLHGGGPGACGRNYVIRADGAVEQLPATAELEVAAGDRFVIETPGGGGWGLS